MALTVVGDGMIAKALKNGQTIVHAAGVSNPNCYDMREFERERESLSLSLKQGKVIYISTCSVLGDKTPYTEHKREMELLVLEHLGTVVRLPTIAGKTENPHTLLNHIRNKILSKETIYVRKNARRWVLDVEDVVASLELAPSMEGVVSIRPQQSHSVAEIVVAMENALGKAAEIQMVEGGDRYEIDDGLVVVTFNDYLQSTINKYYG